MKNIVLVPWSAAPLEIQLAAQRRSIQAIRAQQQAATTSSIDPGQRDMRTQASYVDIPLVEDDD